jgi:hypothetical protein
MEMRVLPKAKAGKNSIWAFNTIHGNDRQILLYDGDHQKFCYYDESNGYLMSNNEYPVNKWYHVAMIFDSLSNATLYIDGNQEISLILRSGLLMEIDLVLARNGMQIQHLSFSKVLLMKCAYGSGSDRGKK